MVVDGEMGEALLEWEQFALGGPVIAFGIERQHPAALEALVDVIEQDGIGMELSVNGDEPGDALDHRPLEAPGNQDRRIAKEVHPRLGGKFGEDGKRVEPVEGV